MKNVLLKLSLPLFILSLVFITSCNDDDPIIDPGDGSVNVSDGMYLAISGENPISSRKLNAETVEDDNFTSQARSGFVGGYVYLTAGNYQLVQVASKEVTQTLGGTTSTVDDGNSGCNYGEYTLVSDVTANGSAVSVADEGFYRVTYDQMTSEMVFYQIHFPGLLGDATEGAWSTDEQLDGSVNADGGSWSKEGVVIRPGQMKIRFNCRWNLDRRKDPSAGNDPSNGYILFTNFGGAIDNLTPGNDQPNITWTESGTYTVTVDWTSKDGFTLDLNRTGDAPVLTFDPNEYKFGVVGDATAGAWDSDQNLYHKEEGGVHSWYGVVTFANSGEYKFRTNDNWDFSLGGDLTNLSTGGGNIPTPGEGGWYIVVMTADEGMTWSATVTDNDWGIIGDGSPAAGWDNDVDMTSLGFDAGISRYELIGDFTSAGEWKFRAGDDWKLSIGGSVGTLVIDGGNLKVSGDGTYKVTLRFDGENFSADVEKQ